MIVRAFKKTFPNFVLDVEEQIFEEGKIYALIGSNGSGKSTYVRTLAGFVKADDKQKVIDEGVLYEPQKPFIFRLSTLDNLLVNSKDKTKAKELLKKLKLPEIKATELSGGQKAKLALARMLMNDEKVLILDEPCAGMDIEATMLSEELLLEYHKKNKGIILLISHSIKQCQRLCEEVLFFDNGRIVERNKSSIIFSDPKDQRLKEFLEYDV